MMLALALSVFRSRQCGKQARWRVERCQLRLPEGFAGGGVARLQPADIVGKAAAAGGQRFAGVVAQHFAQQLRGAPAVEQQVVHGPDQMVTMRAGAQQRHAHQRRALEVEALRALAVSEGVELFRAAPAPVFDQHGQRRLPGHPLQRRVGPVQEAAAQGVVARQHRLPCRAEAIRLDAVDIDAQLVGIGAAVLAKHAVEQHARLHRRQRVEVLHLLRRKAKRIQPGLRKAGEREVGWRQARCPRGAMGDNRLQFRAKRRRQRFDRRAAIATARIGHGQLQLTVLYLAADRQRMRQRRGGILVGARAVGREPPRAVIGKAGVELAQVVEHHLGPGHIGQRGLLRGRAEAAQQAEADAITGHRAQLLLDGLDRGIERAGAIEGDGE
nr:hypothetical protein [Cupriavidus taiwanensis]